MIELYIWNGGKREARAGQAYGNLILYYYYYKEVKFVSLPEITSETIICNNKSVNFPKPKTPRYCTESVH